MNGTVELYQDDAGEWRWRRKAANGEIVAVSGEGYMHHEHALSRARMEADAHGAELVDEGHQS